MTSRNDDDPNAIVHVKPAEGRTNTLADGSDWPVDGQGDLLSIDVPIGRAAGTEGRFWRNRLRDGDVEETRRPPKSKPAKADPKPATEKKADGS